MTFLDYVKKAQSLDEVVSLYAEYQVKAREINWTNGDLVRIAVDHFGDKVYGSLAEAGMGTVKHLQQIEKVARAFDPVYREPMFPWSLYRAAYQAAMRILENGFDDATAVLALPQRYRRKLRTTNMVERLNQEIRRRERVIRIFPNEKSALRLIGAFLIERDEDWMTGRKYMDMTDYLTWRKAGKVKTELPGRQVVAV